MNTSIKNIAAFTAGLLFVLSSCSGDFLDHKPTDAVDSGIVPVPSNAGRIFNGAWYNLFEYSSTYANIGYRALMLQDDMMADDVVSRPMYGFNSSYQFNDVVMPANNRTAFAWYLMYRTIDNCNTAISITATGDDDTRPSGSSGRDGPILPLDNVQLILERRPIIGRLSNQYMVL